MHNQDDHNGRNSFRLPIELLVSVSNEDQSFNEFCANLSASGIFMATTNVLPPGSTVQVVFSLPHNNKELNLEGTVRWSRGSNGEEAPAGMGIMFQGLDAATQEELHNAISFCKRVAQSA